jgi:hypothetical protein
VTVAVFLRYVAAAMRAHFRGAIRRFLLVETWNIAVVDSPVGEILRSGHVAPARWLPSPPRFRFYADPFALSIGSCLHIVFEDFDYRQAKGRISSITLMPDHTATLLRPVLETPGHASYPFLVIDRSNIYCVPETAEERRVSLYRAVKFPDVWEMDAILIDNFAALDSTLFYHEGRWWLFCTSAEPGGEHKLYAWFSPVLRGPWKAHPLNPLKCNPRSSRPAGTPFVTGGSLYRPAQDCSQTYGGAITLNRIHSLSPTDFMEEEVGQLTPDPDGPYPVGLHTLCPAGDVTVVDGKRYIISPIAFALWVWNKRRGRRRRRLLDAHWRTANETEYRRPAGNTDMSLPTPGQIS